MGACVVFGKYVRGGTGLGKMDDADALGKRDRYCEMDAILGRRGRRLLAEAAA